MDASRWMCLLGLAGFIFIAWGLSTARRRFPWRLVISGVLLQIVLGLLVLQTSPGRQLFVWLGAGFEAVTGCVTDGSSFLFQVDEQRHALGGGLLMTFAFGVLPTIIFFSSLMSILYHVGIMQRVVWLLALGMRLTLRTTGPETLAAAANVFVGHTEAPLVVKPYIGQMTRSELNAMMTGGFATVTGALLAAYADVGNVDVGHLLTASVISAPAALLLAKVMVPETETPVDANKMAVGGEKRDVNLIGAAVTGASDGLRLALNVGAMLIAFLALIALVDLGLAQLSGWVGLSDPVTLGQLLGYVGAPLALLMGIPWEEALIAGELIGVKTVANEFLAFQQLGALGADSQPTLSPRSRVILTYALVGFSNFGAIGIQVGGVGALVPERRSDLARMGLRAMLGGLLACCMTGAVAGLVLSEAALESPAAVVEDG